MINYDLITKIKRRGMQGLHNHVLSDINGYIGIIYMYMCLDVVSISIFVGVVYQ